MASVNRIQSKQASGLSTLAGVFTPSLLTILGIILFLRLGHVIGNAGLGQTLAVLALSSALVVVTSISLSAIATNIRVKGGGVYYLISRSLGGEYGGAIGIVLFFAQSVSIAFYCIGFAEAVAPMTGVPVRVLAGTAALLLFGLAWMGADWATRLQYVVLAILAAALGSFVWGASLEWSSARLQASWAPGSATMSFWMAFAIFFPAVTGFTQGANMSGDLKDPEHSLPRGVLASVAVSILVYLGAMFLLAGASPTSTLMSQFDSMRQVSRWGPLVDAGLIAAALSSALASFMGAPRILQSLARDRIFPFLRPFAQGSGPSENPRRGLLLSIVITLITIGLGNLNLIAPVVSMFFLISYGLLNYATYIEARGASPSFRPRFRWFHAQLSLLGALGCLGAMLAIDAMAGALAVIVLFGIQQALQRQSTLTRWADGRRSYYFQRVRHALLAMEGEPEHARDWRPRLLTLSKDPARRGELLQFAAWLEAGSGLNTIVRIIEGEPDDLREESERIEHELRSQVEASGHKAFSRVLVAPNLEFGVQALLQAYGVGPLRANTVLLKWMEPNANYDQPLDERMYGSQLRVATRMGCNVVVLHASHNEWLALECLTDKHRRIDIWWWDDASSRLMLLLAYLVTRSDDWRGASIRVLTPRSKRGTEKTRTALVELLRQARIDAQAEVVVDLNADVLVEHSADAALVLLPMQLRGKQPLDPFGNRLESLLSRLPMTALVRATEDIDLCAEPDDGENSQISTAIDAATDAVQEAKRAEKAAQEALVAAERKRLEMHERAVTPDETKQLKLQKESELAEQSAGELERQARKARNVARNAAANAKALSSKSSHSIQEKARSLEVEAAVQTEVEESDANEAAVPEPATNAPGD